MSAEPSIWSRVRKGRLVQVLAVYLGASWLVIQVSGALTAALALPPWVSPVVVLLLMVGLLVVLATAWVQSNPLVGRRAATDDVPRAWEVDVRDLGRSVRRGRFPHLTWGRALVGGAVAFSLLFGLAGAYVLLSGRDVLPSPSPLAANTAAAPGLAVLPFDARGLDEDLWSTGMVDLLTTNLDGVGGLRTIDSRTVLARWRESHGGSAGDLSAILRIARSAGARWAVVGSAVGVGSRVRLSARLYDTETGAEHGNGQIEGDPGSVLALVDALSIELVRDLIRERQLSEVPARNIAAITTSSIPALRAYLRGEAANRRSDFHGAIQAYEEAIAADSTFALAAYRLSTAYGWVEARGSERSERYRKLAGAMSDRLPARDAALMRAFNRALQDGDPAGIDALERLARTYPDDPEIWTMLGEARYHLGPMALIPAATAIEPFETAIALDSSFAPAYIHPIELKIGTGRDSAAAARLIDAYARYGSLDADRLASMRLAFALLYAPPGAPPPEGTTTPERMRFTMGTLNRGGVGAVQAFPRLLGMIREARGAPLSESDAAGWEAVLEAMLGRPGRFYERWLHAPEWARANGAMTLVVDYDIAIPDSLFREITTVGPETPPFEVFSAGVIATHRDHNHGRAAAVAILRNIAGRGDENAGFATSAADAIEALYVWRRGRTGEAANELERLRVETIGFGATEGLNELIRQWLGELEAERGRHDHAIRYLASVGYSVHARLLLAESLAAVGRADSAAIAYADVLRLWAEAEPGFEPLRRAERGLSRLLAER
jgi:TolB-like protein